MGNFNHANASAKLIVTMANKLELNGDTKTAIVNRANELFMFNKSNKTLALAKRGNNKITNIDKAKISDAKAAGCLYIACRKERLTITLDDIIAVSKVSRQEICKSFILFLNGDEAYWLCEILSVSKDVEEAATAITNTTLDLRIVSERVSNVVVALAAIYMASQASDDKRTMTEISDKTGFHYNTIREGVKKKKYKR